MEIRYFINTFNLYKLVFEIYLICWRIVKIVQLLVRFIYLIALCFRLSNLVLFFIFIIMCITIMYVHICYDSIVKLSKYGSWNWNWNISNVLISTHTFFLLLFPKKGFLNIFKWFEAYRIDIIRLLPKL